MRERRVWMITIMLLVWSALYLVALNATRSHAQNLVVLHPDHNTVPADSEQHGSDDGAFTSTAIHGSGRRRLRSSMSSLHSRPPPIRASA
jgi:hypothetical protein